jgi:hypothetical protein
MKFGPKALRFTLPAFAMFHRYLWFVGRDNTIHLQETAAVVEGDLVRFSLPVLDLFVKRAFAERSMITIPYSRIVRHVHQTYLAAKLIWWLLAAAALAWCYFAFDDGGAPELTLYICGIFALILLVLGVLVHWVFHSRHALTFRRADGKRSVVCFRFTSRKRRREFMDVLKANREGARALTAPDAAASTRKAWDAIRPA